MRMAVLRADGSLSALCLLVRQDSVTRGTVHKRVQGAEFTACWGHRCAHLWAIVHACEHLRWLMRRHPAFLEHPAPDPISWLAAFQRRDALRCVAVALSERHCSWVTLTLTLGAPARHCWLLLALAQR
jgi:hypothetical protein